jgi:3',5'-cyclic AMP phosphodiesterase CpdA
VLRYQTKQYQPPVAAVVQLGDLMEGLAGRAALAEKMNQGTIDAIRKADLPVPWVLVKGNHDGWYGPGEPEAYRRIFIPFVNSQLGTHTKNGFYTYSVGPVEFICCPYSDDRDYLVQFVEKSLAKSRAKYKFVALHTPIIPVTGRCWDLYSFKTANEHNNQQRDKLLRLLARHKAIVLCAHLHKYSLVRRSTEEGPVVQIMLNSVIRQSDANGPYWQTTEYGPSLIALEPQFAPETQDQRRRALVEEAKYITKFYLADMPGYGIISAYSNEDRLLLKVYSGLNKEPLFEVNLTELLTAVSNESAGKN